MYIEDIITMIDSETGWQFLPRKSYDLKFARSISRKVRSGDSLTSRQAFACMRMLRNLQNRFPSDYLNIKADKFGTMLENASWKNPIIPSVEMPSEVRHLGDNILAFRTTIGKPFETRLERFKPIWAHGVKMVAIKNEVDLKEIISVIGSFNFQMDKATEEWLASSLATSRHDRPSVATMDDKMVMHVPQDALVANFFHHVLGADYV